MEFISDEQLLVQVMEGRRSALAPLVERYHAALFGYLYRLTNGNYPLAEDLVQDTFIHVLQQDSFRAGRPFKPWLYSIATHLAYDHFRSADHRRRDILDERTENGMIDRSPSPEEQVENGNSQVAQALSQLGEEYRLALLLRFYQGLSLQEIADVLEIPLGTVKSRLSVGAQRLRSLLVSFEKGEKG